MKQLFLAASLLVPVAAYAQAPVWLSTPQGQPYNAANPLPVTGMGGGGGSSTPTTPNGTATSSSVPVVDGTTGGSVALASKQEPFAVTTTQTGGTTSGTAGTFTTATAANASRHGCTLQNTSTGTLYVFFGSGAASTTNAFQVAASGTITCEQPGVVLTDAIQVGSTIASATYVEALQ